MEQTFKVEGLDEIRRKLNQLDAKIQQRSAGRAVSAGAKFLRDATKNNTPVDTGNLKRNIVMQRLRSRDKQQTRYLVGPRSKKAVYKNNKVNRRMDRVGESYWDKGDHFYAHIVEFGSRKMKAKPFLRPSFDNNKEKIANIIKTLLLQEIENEVGP